MLKNGRTRRGGEEDCKDWKRKEEKKGKLATAKAVETYRIAVRFLRMEELLASYR